MQLRSLLLGVILLTAGFASANDDVVPLVCETLSRRNFDAIDPEFKFATATASYQVEGAASEDGRTPSIWDHYAHTYPERILDGSNADVTANQYHRYKEDVQIMKDLGMDAFRLSISWSRVLPNIEPFVTLFHWDLPQALEEEFGGFRSPRIVDHFRDYAEVLFVELGDRVKHWTTLNEPYTYIHKGYATGTGAPGRCSSWQTEYNCLGGDSGTEPYVVAHNFLLAHAATVQLYRNKYQEHQKGLIGITLVNVWVEPLRDTLEDQAAANRSMDLWYGWFMNPITYGDYPESMRHYIGERLPYFTEEQSQLLKGSYDFLGQNYYTARYATHDNTTYEHGSYLTDHQAIISTERDGVPIGPMDGSDWVCIHPEGLEKVLLYAKEKYNDPIIYITENGAPEWSDPNLSLAQKLNDTFRIDYHQSHLCHIESAMKKGVKVKGYFAWSILDNFEWEYGSLLCMV